MPQRAETRRSYVRQVERAQAGELAAFGELVAGFQDMVVGAAFGWLRDIELARDVAQETFANAHTALAQLEDPAAFPGWLRRIVYKHCDRVARRVRPELAARDPDAVPAGLAPPDAALAERRESERIRRAVEALPEPERLPLVLHYFAGEPQPAVAEFLELSLPTLKKRLRSARARLRGAAGVRTEDPAMIDPTPLRPSRDARFGDAVRFFLALRAGDRAEVSRMLDRLPELKEARQGWDPGLAYDGVLPFASRATPLVTALERDDPAMVELLLAKGASPDGSCGCASGEAPLWTAVLLQNERAARLLLEAGADPDRAAATGNAPLHVASIRNAPDLVALLLEHGADPRLRDRSGRTARDWALAKGHARVASLLPPESGCEAASVASPPSRDPFRETGVKAIDLFAPLAPGSLVRVPFRAGVGLIALLDELSDGWTRRPRGAVLWTGFAQGPLDPEDLRADLREAGLEGSVELRVAGREEPPVARRKIFREGLERGLALRDEGHQVLLVLLVEAGFEVDVEASFPRLAEPSAAGSITTLVVSPFQAREEDGRLPLRAPYDGRITLDSRRARRGLYPALDPVGSLCRRQLGRPDDARHGRVAAAARSVLAQYEQLDPDFALPAPASLPAAQREDSRRAQHLIRYLCQLFVTTECFTDRPGRRVPRGELLDRVETILAGGSVTTDPELTPYGLSRG